MKVFALLLLTVCAVTAYSVKPNPQIQTKQILLGFESQEERLEFLRYHINLGHDLVKNSKGVINRDDNYGPDYSVALYQYAIENLSVHDQTLLRAFRKLMCFDDGTCINIDDPSIHP